MLWYPAGQGCAWPRVGGRRTAALPWPGMHGGAEAALGEGAVSSLGAFKEPPSKGGAAPGRAAQHARTCSCLLRVRTRLHWRRPGRGGGRRRGKAAQPAAMSAALTLPGSAERNQVEGANKAGAPAGRRSTARDLPSG